MSRRKTGVLEENLSVQRREPTNSTHISCQNRTRAILVVVECSHHCAIPAHLYQRLIGEVGPWQAGASRYFRDWMNAPLPPYLKFWIWFFPGLGYIHIINCPCFFNLFWSRCPETGHIKGIHTHYPGRVVAISSRDH